MVTYISLVSFTDQGARTMTESTKRAEAAKAAGKKFGCDMKEMYWTLGSYDLVAIIDAADVASSSPLAQPWQVQAICEHSRYVPSQKTR
jgi:uncharacterized protein with GYD domain